jgi:uncharacterized membrane protein YdbT with pleckstrin-like domain
MSFTKEQLLPGENLILLARQHPLVLFRPVLLNLIMLAILIALSIELAKAWIMAFYIAPLLYFLWEFLEWHRREYILTDRRVVRQEGVFSVSSFDAPLDKINNVFHQQTLFGRLLKYGRVGLETASEQGTTVFDFLSRPLDFKNAIVRQRELYRGPAGAANMSSRPSIPQLIEELASLRDRNLITADEFEAKKRSLLDKI